MRIDGPLHANSGRFLVALAVAGVAITIEPDFIVGPEVRAGRLVPLLRAFEAAPANIYVAYPSRRHLSGRCAPSPTSSPRGSRSRSGYSLPLRRPVRLRAVSSHACGRGRRAVKEA